MRLHVRSAVQRLRIQGRLKKDDIDARMAKALADLPSDLGLQAVDKFSMANLDTVRSKTGFMVGATCALFLRSLQSCLLHPHTLLCRGVWGVA